jgi:catechol 2,3-dioxygenase
MLSYWPLREITVKVLDLAAQRAFYRSFGFADVSTSENQVVMSAGSFQLRLQSVPDLKPRPPLTAGLFHFAILVPDRATLGAFLRHATRHKFNFVGAADHLVSEALYFTDPEDNGIEVYADRPRHNWQRVEGTINMATLPLDLDELASLPASTPLVPGSSPAVSPSPQWTGFPPHTRLGHVHLTVTNLDVSQKFYESLGLHITTNWGPFRFLAYDGYHHHIAVNLAAGHHAAPVSPTVSGLASFSLDRPTLTRTRSDPSHIAIHPPAQLPAREQL